jgi:hypothetical protein
MKPEETRVFLVSNSRLSALFLDFWCPWNKDIGKLNFQYPLKTIRNHIEGLRIHTPPHTRDFARLFPQDRCLKTLTT